jgi:hypothetical protein
MKIYFFIFLLIPAYSFSQKTECDCYKVYSGKFYSVDEGSTDTIIYERTKDKQLEYLWNEPRNKHRLNIIWLTSCKYILRKYSLNPSMKEKIMNGDVIAEIIETGDEFFKVNAWMKKQKKFEMTIYVYPASEK